MSVTQRGLSGGNGEQVPKRQLPPPHWESHVQLSDAGLEAPAAAAGGADGGRVNASAHPPSPKRTTITSCRAFRMAPG
jgi:hypothetical protein